MNGTKQRFAGWSQRFQCALLTLRMLVVPLSGFILSSSLKSTICPFASSFSARFFVASISARCELGMPHRAMTILRPSDELRTTGAG